MNLKRWAALSLLAGALLLALCGCGGVSKEEYDALCAERDHLRDRLEEASAQLEKADTLPVTVSGTFAATVRSLIPDYVIDSETPRAAVVTLFQSGPFVIQTGDLSAELETGRTYVFEVAPREGVEMTAAEYENGPPFADRAIARYGLTIAGFRPAGEDEFGLDSDRLVFEK